MSRSRSSQTEGYGSCHSEGWSHTAGTMVTESTIDGIAESTEWGHLYSFWGVPAVRRCCAGHSCHRHCACGCAIARAGLPIDAHLDAVGAHIVALRTSPRTSRYRLRRLRRILTRLAERTQAD